MASVADLLDRQIEVIVDEERLRAHILERARELGQLPLADVGPLVWPGALLDDLADRLDACGPRQLAKLAELLPGIDVDSPPTAVFGGLDGSVRTWEFGTEKLRTTGPSPDGRAVSAIAVGSVNGRPQALTGSRGGSVCLWDLRDGRLIAHAHSAHAARVSAAAVLERDSGPLAVTAGRDRKLRTWDVRSALGRLQELGPPVATPDEVVSLAVPHSNVGGHEALVAGFGKELASYRLEVGRSPDDWSGLSAG